MVTLHPATSFNRIGFVRGHIALLTADGGFSTLRGVRISADRQTRARPGTRSAP
jgi:hypothetical protein